MRPLAAISLVVALSAAGCGPEIDFSKLFGPPPDLPPRWEYPSSEKLRLIRGVPYETEIVFRDLEGKYDVGLTADLSKLPSGASFTEIATSRQSHTRRGLFHWTPTPDDRGVFVAAFIGRLNRDFERREVPFYTAAPGRDVPPVITAPDTIWVAVGDTVTFDVSAVDPNDEPILEWYVGTANPNIYSAYVPWVAGSIEPTRQVRVAAWEYTPDMPLDILAVNSLGGRAIVQIRVRH